MEMDAERRLMRRMVKSVQPGHKELAGTFDLLGTRDAVVYPRLRERMEDAQKKEFLEKEIVLLGKESLAAP